jgi:hypothetical protein
MTRIGLISDTHMPARWPTLPPAVFELFAGVDLILHAGDVGELWVLDQLSGSAPVIAVYGNDETPAAEAALPYLQTVALAEGRVVLTHAHYPDRAAEVASRVNPWDTHFARRANFARQHGASICVFGHTHIPMALQHDDIWLVNPGAIASGNPWTRQIAQTVAILTLTAGEPPVVEHFDAQTGAPHILQFDPAGFAETAAHYSEPIYEADVRPHFDWLWWELAAIDLAAVHGAILALSYTRWHHERAGLINAGEVSAALMALEQADIDAALRDHPYFGTHSTP